MALDIEEKVDSLEKLAAVAGKPTENYLFAEEVNQIVSAVKELEILVEQNSLTPENFGAFSNGLQTEYDISDSDKINYTDTSDGNKQKKTTWLNIKAKIITIIDALFVPQTRTLTIGAETFDLSANRTFTGGGASKKTQIIEFAWGGGGYASTTNWWKLNSFIQKYGTNFVNGGSITPTTSFSSDTNNFCFRESLMFNGKIKAITIDGDNNGVPWNCDFAIRNHELLNPYNAGQNTAAINNQIVARKQFVVGVSGNQTRTFFTPITDFGDILLPKNSVIKPYFKTEGVANSNWQNVVLKILIEEV